MGLDYGSVPGEGGANTPASGILNWAYSTYFSAWNAYDENNLSFAAHLFDQALKLFRMAGVYTYNQITDTYTFCQNLPFGTEQMIKDSRNTLSSLLKQEAQNKAHGKLEKALEVAVHGL